MKTEFASWRNWDAIRCVAGDWELIVGISAGPRILSLRRGTGANLLYEDQTDFRVGDWRLHGGHRLTVAPEGPESYAPDNAPCGVELLDRGVQIRAPSGRNGTSRVMGIHAATDGDGFDVHHILENHADRPWHGALWAITCVPCAGSVVAPRTHSSFRFWPGASRAQWLLKSDHIELTPDGTRGKAGWHSETGWVASLQREAILVLHCPDVPVLRECVDGGCNLEIFTCSDYMELETLGGKTVLAPGERSSLRQRWRLLAPTFTPQDWSSIAVRAGCSPRDRILQYVP